MITLPKGLTEIGDEAFSGCSGFQDQIAEIPNGVSIGRMAFLRTFLDELRTEEPEFVEEGTADAE